jgi:CheY-like chemotaxis protein
MPDGGTVSITTSSRYIDRPLRGYDTVEAGDYVTLTISDTGTGMSDEDSQRIFEPFYTKKAMGRSGTGLGMAVVWGTVKDHHGYIELESKPGEGSSFTLYFPSSLEETDPKEITYIEDYRGKGETILVVDDVKEQREIASKILEKLGYQVLTAASGEEAVDYLKNKCADLLVLDMIMEPGMDGLDTYKQIHSMNPLQRVVIASGYSETDRVKEALQIGASSYIKKPYHLNKIGIAVKEALGHRYST